MGRRGRRKANYDSEDSYSDDSSNLVDEEIQDKIPWSLIIQDTDDTLMDLNMHYENRHLGFRWLSVADIRAWTERVILHPELLDKNYSVIFKLCDEYDYDIMCDYVGDVYNILDLEYEPRFLDNDLQCLVDEENKDKKDDNLIIQTAISNHNIYEPIDNTDSYLKYMIYNLIEHFSYYIHSEMHTKYYRNHIS